ncbi:MAG TPA: hypothetical protein VF595_07110 [Tepidisphaeraceae bacterium]|jgi:hypothetical protein
MTDQNNDNVADDARPADDLPAEELAQDLAGVPADDIDLSDALALEPDEDVDEFADEAAAAPAPPTETEQLLADLEAPGFFEAGVDLHALDDLTLEGRTPVLERLGPAHFRSKGFSFMGFLQTVYDHVAEQVRVGPAASAVNAQPETPN